MKLFKLSILLIALISTVCGLTGCKDADPNFVHTNNLISAMDCENSRENGAKTIAGTIYEYDKNGDLLEGSFTAEDAAGGSGVIVFIVSPEDRKVFDLTAVYLRAYTTYDEMISPSLSGTHNILVDDDHPEGMVISVTSGIGTVRKYRIMGIYE